MILYSSNQITQGDKIEFITGWEVVFMSPRGLCFSLGEAQKVVEELEMDPIVIKPMVMAVGATMRELCL